MQETSYPLTPTSQIFRDAFDASPVGIAIENLDGQPLFVNRALCSMLGFTEDELCSKHCVQFSPPEDAEKDWVLFQQLRTGSIDHYQLEKRYFRRDGSLLWGQLSLSLINIRSSPLAIAIVEDITEKKKAEEVRFRHSAIVESSDDAIASVALDGVITSWNAGAEKLFGYTECEAVGKSVTFLVPSELLDEENRILQTLRSGARINQFETVRLTKTGRKINVSLSISPIKDSTGEIVGFSGISRDITKRKQAEERLREYERAVEGSEEMIAVVDRDYRYLIANRKFLEMRKVTKEQVIGRLAQEVLNEGVFEAVVKEKLDQCFRGDVVRYELKYSYPEIGERDLLISYFPIEGATGIDRAACIMHDITDRKRSEESLRESEQRFRLAAQAGKMYSFEWDVTTDVVVRSPEHVKVLGPTEPLGRSHEQFMNRVYSEDRAKLIAAIAGLKPESPTAEVIYRVQGSAGSLAWLRSSGQGFFDSEGNLLRVVGMVADITDLKRAEDVVSGMTRKLVEAQEEERARIARELHDDIGQRLALLTVDLTQLEENRPDSIQEIVKRIQELRQRTVEISTDVHSLSRELHSSGLEYLGAVGGIKSWCREFGERQGMRIDFRSSGVPDSVPSEIALCLFRVLQEALYNAAKHSGVKRTEVQLLGESGEIHLIVSDLGKGFEVVGGTQGRGLGLTSMQERVRLVNGVISVESMPMRGTTIHVRVPQVRDEWQGKQGA